MEGQPHYNDHVQVEMRPIWHIQMISIEA